MYYNQSAWEMKKKGLRLQGDRADEASSSCSTSKKHKRSFQTAFCDLKRLPDVLSLPSLNTDDPTHTVLVQPDFRRGKIPVPCSDKYVDKWDDAHVRMPCSPLNQSKGISRNHETQWEIINRVLQMPIKSSKDLEVTIKAYNHCATKLDFTGLHYFFEKVLSDADRRSFFADVLPSMAELVLELPKLCPHPIPLLKRQTSHAITLSQKQVACLLANAFFCTFPARHCSQCSKPEYKHFPSMNFYELYAKSHRAMSHVVIEKMKCIVHYFKRIAAKEPDGCVTFQRQCLKQFPDWGAESTKLGNYHVSSEGKIETEGSGMLQLDFADKFIGGFIFTFGLVQEEIRFVICPELIISRLFTEMMDPNECVIITGCEQFSTYTGYGRTFQWTGDFIDTTARDKWNRRYTRVLAIDATKFRVPEQQYALQWLKRETQKAYCGFWTEDPSHRSAVATGNWGCGVFRGHPHLKALLQWMAASVAGRDLCYFTFDDKLLVKDISNMFDFLKERDVTVGRLWELISQYGHTLSASDKTGLYAFIYKLFGEERQIYYTKIQGKIGRPIPEKKF